MEPFIALMRRYVIDYTNSHDQSVCDEIMEPDYVFHMSGMTFRSRDDDYKPAVKRLFEEMPGLCLAIHGFVTNGNRLAMLFSEHGASIPHDRRLSAWGGIGLYKWNGRRLTENYVEQDYLARFDQLNSGRPHPLEPLHLDPWFIGALPPNPPAEEIVRSWLQRGDLRDAAKATIDDSGVPNSTPQPRLTSIKTEVNDLFSAGDRVPFHITQHGKYVSGIDGLKAEHIGREATLYVAGVARVQDGMVSEVRAISDRWGLKRQLQR